MGLLALGYFTCPDSFLVKLVYIVTGNIVFFNRLTSFSSYGQFIRFLKFLEHLGVGEGIDRGKILKQKH